MELMIALLPIVAIVGCLFLLKQSSLRAAICAYVITVIITKWSSVFPLFTKEIFHASFKGVLISFIVAYVLFFGIFLFHLMKQSGAIDVIAAFISQATDDKMLQVIILVIGFSPLIESASGFGTAFLIVAPVFIASGFAPFRAALIGLISLLAVPWGALATGMVVGAEIGDLSLQKVGIGSAVMSIPVFLYFVVAAVFIAGGKRALQEKWKEITFFSILFGLSVLFFNAYVSVELAGVLAALITTTLGVGLLKMKGKKREETVAELSAAAEKNSFTILKVMSPYLLLTFCIFLSRLVPNINHFLTSHLVIDLPAYSYSLALLYSPGFWLFAASLFAIFILKIHWQVVRTSLRLTIKQWVPFFISTSAFVAMAEVMTEAGMTMFIANAAATAFGTSFVIISPFIGGLGGFLTGSNAGSNAMFIQLQMHTAKSLGISPDLYIYIQNTSASHASMASPARVMLGSSLLGIRSAENDLLKSISLVVIGALFVIILMSLGWMWLF